jgi:hypothetical protein
MFQSDDLISSFKHVPGGSVVESAVVVSFALLAFAGMFYVVSREK